MREIKFRAWDKERKEMINFEHDGVDYYTLSFHECSGESHYSIEFNNSEDEPQYFSRERFELMQCTGLKDKNGKEIYEEDILQWCDTTNVMNKWIVKVTKGGWNPFIDDMTTDKSFRYEIIGNIYNNSELLKERS